MREKEKQRDIEPWRAVDCGEIKNGLKGFLSFRHSTEWTTQLKSMEKKLT